MAEFSEKEEINRDNDEREKTEKCTDEQEWRKMKRKRMIIWEAACLVERFNMFGWKV